MSRILASLLLFIAAQAFAAQDEPLPPGLIPLEQPDIPPPVQNAQPMEPDVTIVRRGKEIIEEYRINQRLYMVKIKPAIGPAYYLVDTDGDGDMDTRRSEATKGDNSLQVPQWVLFRW